MPRIGLISDTHGWLDPRVEVHFTECDEIWHAGDIGGLAITEQLDGPSRREHPEHQRFTMGGAHVWMTHIGGRPPRYTPEVLAELRSDPPTLFICGHSHICLVQFDPKVNCLYMNPGAAGRHGWHKVRTLLRFSLNEGSVKDLEVVELGARGQIDQSLLEEGNGR